MSARFTVRYHYSVLEHDVAKLSHDWLTIIRKTIETKLVAHPNIFGKPLRHSLAGCRKLRVGDYRIVFTIENDEVTVWAIGHRKDIYDLLVKRIEKFLK